MNEQAVDAIICYGNHEDCGPAPYIFDTWFTNDRPGSTVIFPRNGEPLVLTGLASAYIDHLRARTRGEQMWISPENLQAGRDAGTLIRSIKDLGLADSKLGVLGLEPIIPLNPGGVIPFTLWCQVLVELPNATFKSVGEAFAKMVMVLSDEELVVLQQSASIASTMAEAMVKAAMPGATESEVFAAGLCAAHVRGTAAPWMHMNSGPADLNWGLPRWTSSSHEAPRVLQEGDTVSGEIFCNFGMRASQVQVTIAIGEVHEEIERAAKVARTSYEAGLKALRPKARFGDVVDAMLKPLQAAGGWSKGPQIHSLNPILAICSCDVSLSQIAEGGPFSQRWVLQTLQPDLVLEPGMSFAFEPTCAFGPYGATIGGTVVVGQGEAIELNPQTAQLLRAPV